ncbi:hypothetical protein PoB_000729600 [Plakobranchus ocellatus]|uniref:Sushi domain-containing protein n=1 Tax=Plakobranchus ocellatus TaxID=259542 RepID=A0AAV3YC76_9GAST|nr:hypothetical protein PoB_000729600 [Plakobranchus ocellatus]
MELVDLASNACPGLDIPEGVYALTATSESYVTGAVFDLVCIPGNRPETVVQLRCDASGIWLGHWPDCSISEGKAKWWMLLIGLVSVVLLVPCIVPRLYFTFIDTSPRQKDTLIKRNHRNKISGTGRMRDIELQTFSCEASQGSAAIRHAPYKYPISVPQKKQKEYMVTSEQQALEES